jgi:uncharacterized membrane protein
MNIQILLLMILLLAMFLVGGKKGIKSFVTFCVNFIILFIGAILMSNNINPLLITSICCILIGIMTLLYINGINIKTISSLISIVIALILTINIIFNIGYNAKLQGFGKEEIDTLKNISFYIHIDFMAILFCILLFGIVGAIIDVSIAISSSMNEIYLDNKNITYNELYKAGIDIGRDILGTMTNTLLFAYIADFMTLIIWYDSKHYTLIDILNDKLFSSQIFQIISSGIGIILIIPITAFVTSILIIHSLKKLDSIDD